MIWLPQTVQALSSPLLKIPILLTCTPLITKAQTPPNPPPAQDEAAKVTAGGKRDFTGAELIAKYAPSVFKVRAAHHTLNLQTSPT
jgi:hypothetical protein